MSNRNAMNSNTSVIEDAVLALLHLTIHDHNRTSKSLDWDALNRLHVRGIIADHVNRTKSVVLTEEGLCASEHLFKQCFVIGTGEAES